MTSKRPDLYAILEVSPARNPGRDRPRLPLTAAPAPPGHPCPRRRIAQRLIRRSAPTHPHRLHGAPRPRPPSPLRPGRQAPITAPTPATPAAAQTPPRIRPAAHRRRPRLLAALITSSVGRIAPTWTLLAGSADCPDHVPHGRRCSPRCSLGRSTEPSRGRRSANGPARPLRERWDSPRTPRTTSSDGITRDGASAT